MVLFSFIQILARKEFQFQFLGSIETILKRKPGKYLSEVFLIIDFFSVKTLLFWGNTSGFTSSFAYSLTVSFLYIFTSKRINE